MHDRHRGARFPLVHRAWSAVGVPFASLFEIFKYAHTWPLVHNNRIPGRRRLSREQVRASRLREMLTPPKPTQRRDPVITRLRGAGRPRSQGTGGKEGGSVL